MSLKFLSLFSGIGAFDLGLERAGLTCVGQVEIDPFCQRVLAKHWPSVKRMGDIREVCGDEFGPIDAIVGGFPCQDISNAGNQAGITGERSGLWSEFFRLIHTIRPSVVIVENVAALLVRGIETVLRDLASIGYDAEWQVLPAGAFGAAHYRGRIFILAYPASERRETLLRNVEAFCTITAPRRERSADTLDSYRSVFARLREDSGESEFCRASDGFTDTVGRITACGNAVVPAVAEYIGRQIMSQKL